MIEKKIMYYVDFLYPQYDVEEAEVMVDTDSEKVILYKIGDDCEEWSEPNDDEHFYTTVREAQQELDKLRRELRELMPKVRRRIKQMEGLLEWSKKYHNDESDPMHCDLYDYMPNGRLTILLEKKGELLEKEVNLLKSIIQTGFINVGCDNVRVSNVESVQWGDKKARLVLKDGSTFDTLYEYEFNVVRYLFGYNISELIYRSI